MFCHKLLLLENDSARIAVQAKRFSGTVGVDAVQQIVAAKAHYQCNRAMVVTNNYFSKRAKELAKTNGVELWDRKKLTAILLSQQPSTQPPHPQNATIESSLKQYPLVQSPSSAVVPNMAPKVAEIPKSVANTDACTATETSSNQTQSDTCCEMCGIPVTPKVRDYCLANQERFRGNVYCFQHQRSFKNQQPSVPALTSG